MHKKIKIFLHIGFPKTASTFFQKNIFSKHKQINYYGRCFGKKEKKLEYIINNIISMNDKEFRYSYNKFVNLLNNIKFSKKKINLISEEGLLCQQVWKNNDIYLTVSRLLLIFNQRNFDLNIFFFIRNQKKILISFYKEYYFGYFFHHCNNFKNFVKNRNKIEFKEIWDSFKYFKLLKFLLKNYKKTKIKIFSYEDFDSDPKKFIKLFFQYFKINYNINVNFENKINSLDQKKYYLKFHLLIKKNLNIKALIKIPSKILYTLKFIINYTKFIYCIKKMKKLNTDNDDNLIIEKFYKRDNCLLYKYTKINIIK